MEKCKVCNQSLEMKLFQKMEVPYTNEIYYIAQIICPSNSPFTQHHLVRGKFFPRHMNFIPDKNEEA